ncbi:MAG: 16S rRNA (cytosine(1402)-N(4))-methyltransferase RsmH [Bacteroidetes bacterium]|nr:16S rRNA (cytosine(1402)-N(4))-methyltransferase RsmH [Bacteroidota bacterium]
MLREVIEGLNLQPHGIYVDATYGRGGHAKAILDSLEDGKLIAFDQDKDASENLIDSDQMIFIQHNFHFMKRFLKYHDAIPVDGILADLGVSSHQIDVPERGFSTRFEADLDMRMDKLNQLTAKNVVNEYSENDLVKIFSEYGEVRNSRTIARAIIENRVKKPIKTINDLKAVLETFIKKERENKTWAQIFQALRIEVNKELDSLKSFLQQSSEVLRPGGRLVVIAYHSLEDRIVKNFFKKGLFDPDETGSRDMSEDSRKSNLNPLTKKPISPTEEEIKNNPRARSAKLRIAEKINVS